MRYADQVLRAFIGNINGKFAFAIGPGSRRLLHASGKGQQNYIISGTGLVGGSIGYFSVDACGKQAGRKKQEARTQPELVSESHSKVCSIPHPASGEFWFVDGLSVPYYT